MVVEREKSGKEQKEAEDLILDIQFDHSGTRFATACADRHIRVSPHLFIILCEYMVVMYRSWLYYRHFGALTEVLLDL